MTMRIALAFAASLLSVSPCQAFDEIKDCDVCPAMVVLPEGQFVMGSNSKEALFPTRSPRIRSQSPRHSPSKNSKSRLRNGMPALPTVLAIGSTKIGDAAIDRLSTSTSARQRPMYRGCRRNRESAIACFRNRSGSMPPGAAPLPRGIGAPLKMASGFPQRACMPTPTTNSARRSDLTLPGSPILATMVTPTPHRWDRSSQTCLACTTCSAM